MTEPTQISEFPLFRVVKAIVLASGDQLIASSTSSAVVVGDPSGCPAAGDK